MKYDTKDLRNVVLLGHSGSGKTTFAECMLFEAGAISRRGTVNEKNTVSDYTDMEQDRGNSIYSSLMHASWKTSKINILDTPGSDDFVGEVVSSLKVADTAVMLLNARSGVEVGTELQWEYVSKNRTPAMFVINHCDNDKADYDKTLEQAQARFGNKVIPIQYPLNPGIGFTKIVDALRMVMYVFKDNGGKPEKQPIPDSEKDRVAAMHNALVEAAAENDEELMEKYFEEGSLSESDLAYGLRMAIASQSIYPVFICSADRNMGSGRVMGFINDVCPSPADSPGATLDSGDELKCDSSGATTVFVFKTVHENRVGNVTYFKVCSGSLNSGDELINANNRSTERFGTIYLSNGKIRNAADPLNAGDIAATVKLRDTHSNQTLNTKGTDRKIEEMDFPNSRIRTAIEPPGKPEMEKLMKALHIIEQEDLTLKVEQSRTLKQTLLHGQGQLHLDFVAARVEKEHKIKMNFIRPRIPYRETITKEANESYRHKKQSGGSGQFAEVHMRIEPYYEGMPPPEGLTVRKTEEEELPWGGKLSFYWCIVGGSIDSRFINAIKKGIMNKMEEGPLTGSNCQDIRVCIYDGKMHPVDSNDMAFMIAASQGFKNAFENAKPQIMEPIFELEILCSNDVMGDVMGDLQTRRAIIMGMDADGHYQKIIARVPLVELYKYSSTLRSITQGRAKFNRKFVEYAAVPNDLQKQLISEHKSELAEA